MDEENVPDHYPDPEIRDHQWMTCLRELSLFLLLCTQGFILSTTLDYFDEMGLYAFSSAINLILIVTILIFNTLVNKLTGASLDDGIGGN